MRREYYHRNSYQNFNMNVAFGISGYNYRKLCQAIYFLVCLKRPLKRDEIKTIASTCNGNWTLVSEYVDNHFVRTSDEVEEIHETSIPEVSLEEITRARQRVEENGSEEIPSSMREETIEIGSLNFFQNDQRPRNREERRRPLQSPEGTFMQEYGQGIPQATQINYRMLEPNELQPGVNPIQRIEQNYFIDEASETLDESIITELVNNINTASSQPTGIMGGGGGGGRTASN